MEHRGNIHIEEQSTHTPPNDLATERAAIGAMLVNEKALGDVISRIDADDLYSETHRVIFRAIKSVASQDMPVDQLTVLAELRRMNEADRVGARPYLFKLVESVPTAANADRYADLIKRYSQARRGIDISSRLEDDLFREDEPADMVISRARNQLDDLIRADRAETVGTLESSIEPLLERMDARKQSGGVTGVPTDLKKIDSNTGGWQGGRLTLLAGRTNMGKTLSLLQFGVAGAKAGNRVLYQSPEMTRLDLLERSASSIAEIEYNRLKRGQHTKEDREAVRAAGQFLSQLDLFVDDAGKQTTERIRRNMIRYDPVDLLVVDYLQKIRPSTRKMSRNDQIAEIIEDLTAIAHDFDCAILLGSQLSREVERRDSKDRRPRLSDLRDSGVIEEAGDAVIFVYRDSYYNDDAPEDEIEFLCEKDRHGDPWAETLFLKPGIMTITDRRYW